MNIEGGTEADPKGPDAQGVSTSAHSVGHDMLRVDIHNTNSLINNFYGSLMRDLNLRNLGLQILATSGIHAGDRFQLWLHTELFKSGNGTFGMEMGYNNPTYLRPHSAYANWLLAAFHFIEGERFIRYRDIMGFVFGKYFYYMTYISQFSSFFLMNMGFILLGGRALKEMHLVLSDSPWRLQYYIIFTGLAFFLFAFFIPTMSAMRAWLMVSAVITSVYVILLIIMVVNDGRKLAKYFSFTLVGVFFIHSLHFRHFLNKQDDLIKGSYEVGGSQVGKLFNAFAAISALIAANSEGCYLKSR
ncbi:hypothetical protein K2173_028091 [Erythroxylum novogranatense]|uniref:Amino acid transporter transmembrane domain-containing protein n=1 Tax=Erythroxylum novogranatense TaxID=1862640 RepID=A0AAV8U3W1_9ROSI|nr:hypothetical protein K2173_028091 [Erythroxylum novogranatense]